MSTTIDEQFVEYVIKSIVGKPDEVKIERRVDEKGVLLELTVDPEDLGRVIGKRGATAQSLRTLLRALGTKNEARYNLKIIDNGPEDMRRQPRDDTRDDSRRDDRTSQSDVPSDDMPADTTVTADEPATEPVDEPKAAKAIDEAVADLPGEDDSSDSDRLSRTRKELEDLDDLDI